MTLFKNQYRIESIRLPEYDYSQIGIYFVTICCYEKQHFFGEIKNGVVLLSPIGQMAQKFWLTITQHFQNVMLDQFVIMPNHMHGLIQSNPVETQHVVSLQRRTMEIPPSQNKFQHIIPKSLGVIIRGYKSAVTDWSRRHDFEYIIWQSNYYEHIVRDENGLNRIREYIKNNPANWKRDRNNI